MSKYNPLWKFIQKNGGDALTITFEDIQQIVGFPLDHSFLNCKKELLAYGYRIEKISLNEQTVFIKKAPCKARPAARQH